jgi:hypothetical protein
MERKTTQYVVLAVLVVVLAVVLVYQFWLGPGAAGPTMTAVQAVMPLSGAAPQRASTASLAVPEVKLPALKQKWPEPEASARNPFRLKPPPAPVLPPQGRAGAAGVNAGPPPGPPPPPPITLKFIGLVNPGGNAPRIAVLANGPDVFYGREGDIVDGRYKIVSIGAESVVVSYADGRGTRRIALTGS